VTALMAGQAPPTVAPMPLVGRANVGAQGTPSEVTEQPAMAAIPLPSTTGRTWLSIALTASIVVGATQQVTAGRYHGGA